MPHVCQPDGKATSLDCPCDEIPSSSTGRGDQMLASTELYGVPGWLSGTDAGETLDVEEKP